MTPAEKAALLECPKREKRHKWVAIKEPWQSHPKFYYFNSTIREAMAMHREDIAGDPRNPVRN
jgi:hypothetical protein